MFDIGWSELLLIGIVALVVIGPKELPGVIRAVAQNIGKLRRMASDFQGQFTDAVREMELSDLKKDAEKLISDATSIDEFKAANEEIRKAVEEPSSATAPANSEAATPAPVAEPAASSEGEALPKPEKGSGA